jgi:hypothetical protein
MEEAERRGKAPQRSVADGKQRCTRKRELQVWGKAV